ncbi:hypothetical protein LGM75_24685 [Burkholderia multivorans]|uniref:hypothetical protein n=1 Tax=Burkholderia multivorans TaxID=87883 RepID=UPI001C211218|nr:hypothetical protein [Burkholderia multivorans]MBU9468618.1 hypothetical protein [Burkholderia multivorans]MCA8129554.1 hypothetical protein [Burkholderia multivorans]
MSTPAVIEQPRASVPVRAGFFDLEGFELLQRVAKAFASSSLVPQQYQNNVANCMIALNLASRLKADELMVMQNLYVVHGRPGWSAKFLIATFNHCGRFTAVKYEFFGTPNTDDWGCRASSTELASGEKIVGPDVTIKMAKDEGWYNKNGSKWKTIPQLMLMYRSAGWMINTAAPEISMGLPTQEELHDIIDVRPDGTVTFGGVEEGGTRAPAAVEVPQPKAKSERAAEKPAITHADADGVIETRVTPKQAEPVQQARSLRRAAADEAQPQAAREPGADDEPFALDATAPGEPVSDSVLRILKTKMEQAALGEADMRKRFKFGYDGVTKANYNDVVAWIECPMGE